MKIKLKKKTKPVSVYLTDEQYETLVHLTKDKQSLTEWFVEAMELKLDHDSDDLRKESIELCNRLNGRCEELKNHNDYEDWLQRNGIKTYKY